MKFKQVLKFGFFGLQSIKELYLLAKKGQQVNQYVLMKFITNQLIMLNPIIPHFSQYCWNAYVWPILEKSQNFGATCSNLNQMSWPVPSAPHDKVSADRLNYLTALRVNVTEGLEKAKSGGKKKGKGKQEEEKKEISKCYIFVAKEYPEFKRECLSIL